MKTLSLLSNIKISNLIITRYLTLPLTDRQTDIAKLNGTIERFLIVYPRVTNVMLLDQHVFFSSMGSLHGIFQWIEKKQLKISPLCILLVHCNHANGNKSCRDLRLFIKHMKNFAHKTRMN
jgi:hypothetical protein